MSREELEQAIVLKKQVFGEADEIISVYGLHSGKQRFLAKSIRLGKSRLQNILQQLFLVNLRLAGGQKGGLKKVIGAETVQTFPTFRTNGDLTVVALYAVEIFLKFMPDEEKNPEMFTMLKDFFSQLSQSVKPDMYVLLALFQVKFLKLAGYEILDKTTNSKKNIFFSPSLGQFINFPLADTVLATQETYNVYVGLQKEKYSFKDFIESPDSYKNLCSLLNIFLEKILERELKSSMFLKSV